VAPPGLTFTVFDRPVIVDAAVSVARMVSDPAVLSVAGNDPTPFVNLESAGKAAFGSPLVKWTVPT
jgi:hypothetical protein